MMKKVKFLLAGLILSCSMTQAQNSPEGIIGQCPDLLSSAIIANHRTYNSDKGEKVQAYHNKIRELKERNDALVVETTGSEADIAKYQQQSVAAGEKHAKQMTGKSLSQLQNMSKAEKKAVAKEAANKQLQAVGLGNMNIDDLQALEGKSDEEIMAAMNKKGATFGGLTPAELKAMEGMTDEQIEAYMNQGDRMQRVQNATYKMPQVKAKITTADYEIIAKANEEFSKFLKKVAELRKRHDKGREAVGKQIDEVVYPRHAAAIESAKKDIAECWGLSYRSNAWCDTAFSRMNAVNYSFYTDAYNVWCNYLSKELDSWKTLLSSAAQVDKLQKQAKDAQAKIHPDGLGELSKKMRPDGFCASLVASGYLDVAKDVTNLPSKKY
jgi:hypothetical protein